LKDLPQELKNYPIPHKQIHARAHAVTGHSMAILSTSRAA